MNNPLKYYNDKINNIKGSIKVIEKKSNICSIFRLLIVFITLISFYILFKKDNIELMALTFIIGSIAFIIVAFFHNSIINNKNELLVRLEYYQFGIKRIDNTWKEFEDCGEEFKNINHNLSSDLDIFGVGSLFQWCNTTRTKFGRKALCCRV